MKKYIIFYLIIVQRYQKKERNNIKSYIKNNDSNTVDFGCITDKQKRKLIEVTMNDNKFIFIGKLAF